MEEPVPSVPIIPESISYVKGKIKNKNDNESVGRRGNEFWWCVWAGERRLTTEERKEEGKEGGSKEERKNR